MWQIRFMVVMSLVAVSTASRSGLAQKVGYGEKPKTPTMTVESLRKAGPAGLKKALAAYDRVRFGAAQPQPDELKRLSAEIDRIAAQRHATISRLYWYTDLDAAKRTSRETDKPILSLRMLGKLTDEFSCANSRFFRTALYANEAISKTMRENFVLHWQSVRPVPKVTIDFGDGRVLQRTVTGNSAHYVLNAAGEPLDVLPGLYSPKEFQAWLDRTLALTAEYLDAENPGGDVAQRQRSIVRNYHYNRLATIRENWERDIMQVAPQLLAGDSYSGEYGGYGGGRGGYGAASSDGDFSGLLNVSAIEASTRAFSKAGPELPVLEAIQVSPQQTDRIVTEKLWRRLAESYRDEVRLDEQSVAVMRRDNPTAFQAGALAVAKRAAEDPLLQVVQQFEESIALDTVRNEYLLHRQLHSWLAESTAALDYDALNERVYAELFLTPSSDPWLGLVPANTYTALQNDGLSRDVSVKIPYGRQR